MTEAAKRAIEFGFNDLNLVRINVSAAVENEGSNATIKKLGFAFEGTKRKGIRTRSTGEWRDTNFYGLLKED